MDLEKLKFPIGHFEVPTQINSETISKWIASIEKFPSSIKEISKNLTKEQLNWVYRPDGWTIKQVIHHCADSHLNSLCRFKLALTKRTRTFDHMKNSFGQNCLIVYQMTFQILSSC